MEKITVLIADDHPVVREGLATMLQSADDIEVVGQAVNGHEAVEQAIALRPDILIIDIQMPIIDGIEATRQVSELVPSTQVVVLSSFDQEEYIYQSIQAGAKGYILKDSSFEELYNIVKAAAKGEALLPAHIATKLVERISDLQRQRPLTPRELEVLDLLVHGLRNREIADNLNITVRTVKNHVTNIMAKLNVKSRTEAISKALSKGLVELD